RNHWPCFVGRLPLFVSNYPQLQPEVRPYRKCLCHRIVEIQSLPRMNLRSLLWSMEFVHLEGGRCCGSGFPQVKSLAGRNNRRPVTRADIVSRTCVEFASGSQKTESGSKIVSLFAPSKN